MKKGIVILVLFLLLAFVGLSYGQSPIGRDDFAVIRVRDGLRIGLLDDGAALRNKLGVPLKVERVDPFEGVDPAKREEALKRGAEIWISIMVWYPELYFEYFENNGKIYEIEVTSPEYVTPRGLRVGQTLKDIKEKYHFTEVENLTIDEEEKYYYKVASFYDINMMFDAGGVDEPPELMFLQNRKEEIFKIFITLY